MNKSRIWLLITVIFLLLPLSIHSTEGQKAIPVFSINLISPNTSAARNQWALLMENQLPKIGIEVDFHESTSRSNVGSRTWNYPLINYNYIPTYEYGGYDICFLDFIWDNDWYPLGLYDSSSRVPYGMNFYQYYSSDYDVLLNDFISEQNQETRIDYAHQMQEILYEELPFISILYPEFICLYNGSLIGIENYLEKQGAGRYEYWDDPKDHIIKYAVPTWLSEYNSFVQFSHFDNLWMQGVYGSLYKRHPSLSTWETQIAASFPSLSSDMKNFTIEIGTNAQFSDGSPVLAEDIEYSLELYLTPEVKSPKYSFYRRWFSSNDSVTALDESTIAFNMTQANVFLLETLGFSIIDKSIVEPLILTYGYEIFEEEPLSGNVSDALVKSCGPFKLERYVEPNPTNYSVKLVPNPYYANLSSCSEPLLEELYFGHISGRDTAVYSLQAGEIDIVDGFYYPVDLGIELEGIIERTANFMAHEELAINMRHPVLGTGELTPEGTPEAAINIRKAISHLTPREIIIDNLLDWRAQQGVTSCPQESIYFNENLTPYAYDIDLALDYMEMAGVDVRIYDPRDPWLPGVLIAAIAAASIIFLFILVYEIVKTISTFKENKKKLKEEIQ